MEDLIVGEFGLAFDGGGVMFGLGAELTIFAAAPYFGGDDGAEFYIAATELDADFVGPVEKVVEVVAGDAREVFGVLAVEEFA